MSGRKKLAPLPPLQEDVSSSSSKGLEDEQRESIQLGAEVRQRFDPVLASYSIPSAMKLVFVMHGQHVLQCRCCSERAADPIPVVCKARDHMLHVL